MSFDIHRDVLPMIQYQIVRSRDMGQTRWDEAKRNLQGVGTILHQHVIYNGPTGPTVLIGSIMVRGEDDFCAGVLCRSGMTMTRPEGQYTRNENISMTGANLNEIAGIEELDNSTMIELMDRSLMSGVLSYCVAARKTHLHWADKQDGCLTEVMKGLERSQHKVVGYNVQPGTTRVEPANCRGVGTACDHTITVGVEVFSTPHVRNMNSGNDCASHNAVLDYETDEFEYCPDCDDYLEGESECCCGWESPPSPQQRYRIERKFIDVCADPEWWYNDTPHSSFYNG